jgi:hypothetical protein
MRENRTYGSEGGATQLNALFLPLSRVARECGCASWERGLFTEDNEGHQEGLFPIDPSLRFLCFLL